MLNFKPVSSPIKFSGANNIFKVTQLVDRFTCLDRQLVKEIKWKGWYCSWATEKYTDSSDEEGWDCKQQQNAHRN